ncbi:MAG: LytTR family DNA-binding domain-containing protein [Bacteroidaceae bacterium]|nr:LytTR family DNA-binding domain-containing protein [Bacteroidaceae bacterium]
MKIRCAIVDDEPLAVNLLKSYVEKTPFLELIKCYNSAISAKAGLEEEPVDLLFLDIQMPELSGIEFAKMVDEDTRIIFTTAFSQYAVEGFKANAIDYLLKPISYDDFLKAAEKAQGVLQQKKEEKKPNREFMFVKSEYRVVRIDISKITYIEGLKDYIKIYQEDKPKPVLTLMSMKALEDFLPEGFRRVHRSYIVQLSKMEVIERSRILFGNNDVPISDSNREFIQQYINENSI